MDKERSKEKDCQNWGPKYPTICTEKFLGEKVIKSDDAFNHSDCALVSEKLLIKSLQFSEV